MDFAAEFSPGNTGALYSYGGLTSAAGKNQANGFVLNAVDLALDKPMDETPWASGYHVELEVEPNIPFGIRQAYLALRTPHRRLQPALIGKSVISTPSSATNNTAASLNPNYTRSYGYTIEPTGHTGIIGTYKVCDALSITAGVADQTYFYGNTAAFNTGLYTPTVLSSLTLTAPDSWGWFKGATLSAGVVNTGGANGRAN